MAACGQSRATTTPATWLTHPARALALSTFVAITATWPEWHTQATIGRRRLAVPAAFAAPALVWPATRTVVAARIAGERARDVDDEMDDLSEIFSFEDTLDSETHSPQTVSYVRYSFHFCVVDYNDQGIRSVRGNRVSASNSPPPSPRVLGEARLVKLICLLGRDCDRVRTRVNLGVNTTASSNETVSSPTATHSNRPNADDSSSRRRPLTPRVRFRVVPRHWPSCAVDDYQRLGRFRRLGPRAADSV